MGMVTCVYLVMKFMVIHVYICLDLHTSCRVFLDTVFFFINSPFSKYFKKFQNMINRTRTFQICTLLPTLQDLHQEMKPTNLLVPFGLSVFFQINLWGLSLRLKSLNAGLKTRSDF